MSELEKRQRDEYQKKRNIWILIEMIVAALLVFATVIAFVPYAILNNNTYVYYAEDGKANTKVYLADNSFYDEEYLDANHAYVAALVKNVETEFKYGLAMDANKVDYKYSYTVDATVKVIDRDSKAPLYDPNEVLKEVKDATSSESELYITEKVNIDYAKYNKIADDFVKEYGIEDATANLVVRFNINVLGESETLAEDKSNSYSMEVTIPLLRQTLKITTQSSVPEGEQKILACDTVFKTVLLVIWIIFLSLSVIAIAFAVVFTILTRDKHIDYARKVKKLLSSYKSYIQRISNPFDFEGYKVLNVMTFAELLEIGDKLQNPVLMYENEDKTRSDFFIATCSGIIYLYTVEVEDDEDAEEAAELAAELNEEPTEEAEEVEEPIEEIEEPIAEQPEAPAEEEAPADNTVEAIDIKWEDDNRTYRYDPNGETVDEGDVVLVPTNIGNVGEVEREAEVARGNYRIPADEVKTPLKKIIAVVRRRMQSFVASSSDEAEE